MEEKIKAKIMDEKKMKRTFLRLAMEILERNREAENLRSEERRVGKEC
jgi:pyrimidine operon attenuation protein/uracil phosphoribosyltransferase